MNNINIDAEVIDKLKTLLRHKQIPAYRISINVFNKSSSFLTYRLNTKILNRRELDKILNFLEISYDDLINFKGY